MSKVFKWLLPIMLAAGCSSSPLEPSVFAGLTYRLVARNNQPLPVALGTSAGVAQQLFAGQLTFTGTAFQVITLRRDSADSGAITMTRLVTLEGTWSALSNGRMAFVSGTGMISGRFARSHLTLFVPRTSGVGMDTLAWEQGG